MKAWMLSAIVIPGFAIVAAGANAADLLTTAATSPPTAAGQSGMPNPAQQAAASPAFEPAPDQGTAPVAAESWTAFHEFLFDFDRADIPASDKKKIAEIAAHMAEHPAMRLGIDGSADPNGNGLRNKSLSDQRIAAVHDALIRAGVPADKIQLGEFADPRLRRDRQVEVVLGGGP